MDISELTAITTASTQAKTDVASFIPQSPGIRPADLADGSFMPKGNAITIKR